jgi:hypothetical protein
MVPSVDPTKLSVFVRHAITAGRALAHAARHTFTPPLKCVSNVWVRSPKRSDQPGCADTGSGAHAAAEPEKKLPAFKTMAAFERELAVIDHLPPEQKNVPLGLLGREISLLPDKDQLPAIRSFREAVSSLPEVHRRGLMGMFDAAKLDDRRAFANWELLAIKCAQEQIRGTAAEHSYSVRKAITENLGLTTDWARSMVEWSVRSGPAVDLIRKGFTAESVIEKYDLDAVGHREGGWDARRYLDGRAVTCGPAKLDLITGKMDYVEVAKKYGITDWYAQQKLKEFSEQAYLEPLGEQAFKELLDGHSHALVACINDINSPGLIQRMKDVAQIIALQNGGFLMPHERGQGG